MQSGIFDKTRLAANVLMVMLVALNIFFSIQYTKNIRLEDNLLDQQALKTEERIQTSRFMKLFIDKVLGTNGSIAFEDRVKLEADIRGLGDAAILEQWEKFVSTKTSEEAQSQAVLLMSMLANKML